MATLYKYVCNFFTTYLYKPCQWCLTIVLACSPQLLNSDLSAPVRWFRFGLDIFPTKLLGCVRLGWLYKGVLVFLFFPFFLFLYPKIPFELMFLKVRIYRFLVVLAFTFMK